MGVSPFLYTNIQHISAKSKCPPSELEISLFLIFYTWQPLAQNSKKFAQKHTEFCLQFFRQKNIRTYFYFHAKSQRARSNMFLCSSVKNRFHAKSQRARSVMSFCSSVKNCCTQNPQTQNFVLHASAKVCAVCVRP